MAYSNISDIAKAVTDGYAHKSTSTAASYSLTAEEWVTAEKNLMSEDIASNFSDISASSLDAFNRYRLGFPGDEIDSLIKFVFIVKPDLNMRQAVAEDPYFAQLAKTHPYLISNLTYNPPSSVGTKSQTDFVPFLYDRTIMYQIPPTEIRSYTIAQPFTGFKVMYLGNGNDSKSGNHTQISFRENNRFDVTRYFEAWYRYIEMVSFGTFAPYREYQCSRLLNGVNEVDYATSVYELITKPDATTLVYWHKMTGLMPTGVPHDNWSYAGNVSTEDREITIEFVGGYPEALTPRILADFNYNAGMYEEDGEGMYQGIKNEYISTPIPPARNARIGFEDVNGGSTLVRGPYIAYDDTHKVYKLKWRRF